MLKPPARSRCRRTRGFSLVITLSLMVLLSLIAVGLLGLATVEIRKSTVGNARSVAANHARLALVFALGQLQKELGDDRRITADASLLSPTSRNPHAVGVWKSWSPALAHSSTTSTGGTPRVNYAVPKTTQGTSSSATGFRGWLASGASAEATLQRNWHETSPDTGENIALLFTEATSGFDLSAAKVMVDNPGSSGALAWAVTQENTKARINLPTEDSRRPDLSDVFHAPSRPWLGASSVMRHPDSGWPGRASKVISLGQAALDPSYGMNPGSASRIARDFTATSLSLLTDPVRGGVKVDLNTGFELGDGEYTRANWNDAAGQVANPFRGGSLRSYKGEQPLFTPVTQTTAASVHMNFPPASVNHSFEVNGAPTFDHLRSHYRIYRHLYQNSGGPTAFERPYSHSAITRTVPGRPFGSRSQTALTPVLDRFNLVFSIMASGDGTLGILLTPFVTLWNPHNTAIETEGVVVYPWIDFAVFWSWNVTSASGSSPPAWNTSLSRFVGEGYQGHGRSTRPYFYLHLTQTGNPAGRSRSISPPLRLEPGEVRMFCLADPTRRDLEVLSGPAARTWRMRPVQSASDLTNTLRGGIVLNMRKSIGGGSNFNYQLKPRDRVNSSRVEFDRNTYYYIVNMADAWQIRNPDAELMVEARPAGSGLPALAAEPNQLFYSQVHAGLSFGKGRDSFTYPSFAFEQIRENPQIVGSMLTYHRTALSSGTLPQADLMFTTNPRQPYITPYLGAGAQFQTAPHYESLLQGGTSLPQLAMESSGDGRHAFYGASHSAARGRSFLPFFEIPRAPILSLAGFQHCDLSTSAFGIPNQVGNSWASPYLPAASVSRQVTSGSGGESISPLLGVYDHAYLANEKLFDRFFMSGAVPETATQASAASASPDVWNQPLAGESKPVTDVLAGFFDSPRENPLRNPRMVPYPGRYTESEIRTRLAGPARAARLAAHLLLEGGFNVNSTSEEAWIAVLSSLRGTSPAAPDRSPQSRFRHILPDGQARMSENDPWSGFRSLSDAEIRTLARNLVNEIRARGPFLSLGEFVNRRISSERNFNLAGALQTAIDKSNLNPRGAFTTFDTSKYPNPENLPSPSTGMNTPGWLSQADLLQALAPVITVRSDTFTIRTQGEARDAAGRILATVRLEAVVQRVPDWIDPADDPAEPFASLKSALNQRFGRRFVVVSIRELRSDSAGNPI